MGGVPGTAGGAVNTPTDMQGGNIYQTSANTFGGAVDLGSLMASNLDYMPGETTYDPVGYQATSYNPASYQSTGYQSSAQDMLGDPDQAALSRGYTASKVGTPHAIRSGMGKYFNPYTGEVIDNAMQDIDRSRRMAIEQNAGDAAAAGAFGGSRHGLVEAETNRGAMDAMGRTAGNLRLQGWESAANLSGQDVQNKMRAREFNVDAINRSKALREQANTQIKLGNMQAANQMMMQAAGLEDSSRSFSAQAENVADSYNATNLDQANRLNTQRELDSRRYMADAENRAAAENADANFRVGNEIFNRAQTTGDFLGNVGTQALNIGDNITDRQNVAGAQVDAIINALLGATDEEIQQYLSNPERLLSLRTNALGANPGSRLTNQTTTTQEPPQPVLPQLLGTVAQSSSRLPFFGG